jgi:phosphoglycerate dehydrogenase-like enzyme
MGMEVFAIKRNKKKMKGIKLYSINNLKKVAKGKNYVVNLLPYTKETTKIFDITFFSQMDKNSFFINVGRGETVNEADLLTAIKRKFFLGAALDVVENEPIKTNSRLLRFKNIIVTPHIAGITNDYWVKQYDLFFKNFKNFKRSKQLQNVVKMEIGY